MAPPISTGVFTIVLFAICARTWASAQVGLQGGFPEGGPKGDSRPNAMFPNDIDIPLFSYQRSDGFDASYFVEGSAINSNISLTTMKGPSLYANATATGGSSGAHSRAFASWYDVVRLDDGGDPNVLESINQLDGVFLSIRAVFRGSIQGTGTAAVVFGLGPNPHHGPSEWTSGFTVALDSAEYLVGLHDALQSGIELLLQVEAFADAGIHETASCDMDFDPLSFAFILSDQQGHLVPYDSVPAGLKVVSNLDPNRWYPLLPAASTSEPGDYNRDGYVDAADFVFWRDQNGKGAVPGTGADGTGDGQVDMHDYDVWRAHFAKTSGSGAGVAVPEPSTLMMCSAVIFAALPLRRRKSVPQDRV